QDFAFESIETQVDRSRAADTKALNAKHAFTISAIVTDENEPYNQFLIYMAGTRGSITVHWGDGTSTNYPLGGTQFEVAKLYAAPGRYEITVTGDIRNITFFQSSYGQGVFDNINFRPLTGLEGLRMSSLPGPEILDVSRARNLQDLTPTDIKNLREIRLPHQHELWAVSISGDTSLTSATVNALINSVYQNAVKKQRWGFFHLPKFPYDETRSSEMVGPPSAASIAQLTELQNKYGWEIVPEMPRPEEAARSASGQ
ncbi:MAG TPA: hypothetical protein VEB86_13130, partial [Chryseosolibacter sp.]|nr:hypothetical protein [Chryseosolibacter sp.]